VTKEFYIFADSDGVIFFAAENIDAIINTAKSIQETERRQAERIASGDTLRIQLKVDEYVAEREKDPAYTFRNHLEKIGGAIEV
jgi:regulator of RNase E activity RraA